MAIDYTIESTGYANWTTTTQAASYVVTKSMPLDRRTVIDSLENLGSVIPERRRYRGLKIFVLEDLNEYWFRSGIEDEDLEPYLPAGSGVPAESIINFTTSDHVDPSDNTSALVTSINDVTSDAITAKYGTPTPGAETNVVFTETIGNQDHQTCRRYVYLNGGWHITRGAQEFIITFPAYAANNGSWQDWNPNDPNATPWPSGMAVSKGDAEGFVNVYLTHQFDSQFVDAFVFTTGTADLDGDLNADPYGDRVLASATCFKSSQTGEYKVKIVLPINANNETVYAITIQK